MEVIFILGAALSFFLSFLVYDKKDKSAGDYVLFVWLSFIGLHLLNHYLLTTGFMLRHPHLLGIGIVFPMLQGPFAFVYVLTLINKSGKFKLTYLLHGLPFLIVTLFFMFDFYFLTASEKLAYYEQEILGESAKIFLITSPNIFIGPIYIIWSLSKLRKHRKNITNDFSYTEMINLNWLRYVLAFLVFVWVVVIIANVASGFGIISDGLHDHTIYLAVTIVMFFLGYFGIKQKTIYSSYPIQDTSKTDDNISKLKTSQAQYAHSSLKKDEALDYQNKLIDYFEKEKPYLNGKLSLNEVSNHIEISVNHLSQVINEQLGKTFYDFVNGYRVDEVKSRISNNENENFTLLAIAYDSGFNSKSSFNNFFKKITGLTPSQYTKSITA